MGDNVRMGCLPWASFLQAIDTFLPVGGINRGMKGHDQRYLRAGAGISMDKSGDILPQCRATDRQDKVHISLNSANGFFFIILMLPML